MTAGPHEVGPGDAEGPPDGTPPADEADALEELDALRRAVYTPGASAADLAAYEHAAEVRRAAPSRDADEDDIAIDVAPVPPQGRAATRRRSVVLLAGAGMLVAVLVVGIVAELLQSATPTPSPRVTPVAPPADPSTTPRSSLDPTDRSARFREGSGGAIGTLRAPALAGTVLVGRSDADPVRTGGTVDGFGGRLEFAIACGGSGTVTMRLAGTTTSPLDCRGGRPSRSSVVVAAPAHSVRYSISVQGSARWVLAVGRTRQSSSSPAADRR